MPTRMAGSARPTWPDALILLGDQLYADELTPESSRRVAGRRSRPQQAGPTVHRMRW